MHIVDTLKSGIKLHQKAWEHHSTPEWYLYNGGPLDVWNGLQIIPELPEWAANIIKLYGAWKSAPSTIAKTFIPDDETETFEVYIAKWEGKGENGATCYLSPLPLIHLPLERVGYRNGDVIEIKP